MGAVVSDTQSSNWSRLDILNPPIENDSSQINLENYQNYQNNQVIETTKARTPFDPHFRLPQIMNEHNTHINLLDSTVDHAELFLSDNLESQNLNIIPSIIAIESPTENNNEPEIQTDNTIAMSQSDQDLDFSTLFEFFPALAQESDNANSINPESNSYTSNSLVLEQKDLSETNASNFNKYPMPPDQQINSNQGLEPTDFLNPVNRAQTTDFKPSANCNPKSSKSQTDEPSLQDSNCTSVLDHVDSKKRKKQGREHKKRVELKHHAKASPSSFISPNLFLLSLTCIVFLPVAESAFSSNPLIC